MYHFVAYEDEEMPCVAYHTHPSVTVGERGGEDVQMRYVLRALIVRPIFLERRMLRRGPEIQVRRYDGYCTDRIVEPYKRTLSVGNDHSVNELSR